MGDIEMNCFEREYIIDDWRPAGVYMVVLKENTGWNGMGWNVGLLRWEWGEWKIVEHNVTDCFPIE